MGKRILEIFPNESNSLVSFLEIIKKEHNDFDRFYFGGLLKKYNSFVGKYKLNFKKNEDKVMLERINGELLLSDYGGQIAFPENFESFEKLVDDNKAIIEFKKLNRKIISKEEDKYFIENMFNG